MKNIKYKAWVYNLDLGKHILQDVLQMDFSVNNGSFCVAYTRAFRQSDPFNLAMDSYDYNEVELLEFTGQYDVEGKEIYRGYILQFSNGNLGEVIRSHLRAGFDVAFANAMPEELDHNLASRGKVVGNIYENKELLE